MSFNLESLALCALDADAFFRGPMGAGIDFRNLTSLKLESCLGLSQVFPLLLGPDASPPEPTKLLRLKAFYLRHEQTTVEFQQSLGDFLCSFSGLQCLHVLLEGCHGPMGLLLPVVMAHGSTLRKLVWDERSDQRTLTSRSTSMYYRTSMIEVVSIWCPNLCALGITMDWRDFESARGHHEVWLYPEKILSNSYADSE